jgi:crossover junction endodeoxyribonuclease RuvC
MLILGIDPGLRASGVAVIDHNYEIKFTETLYTETGGLSERLYILYEGISKILDDWNPDVVVIESTIYYRNVKTALTLGAVRGAFLLAVAQKGVEVAEISPTKVKLSLTGQGRAKKKQVAYMVKNLVKLNRELTEHEFDAVGVCIAYLRNLKNAIRLRR